MPLRFAAGPLALAATSIALLLALAACGGGAPATATSTAPTPPAEATAPPSTQETAPQPTAEPTITAAPQPTIVLPPEPTAPPTPSGIDPDQQTIIYSLVAHDLLAQSEAAMSGTVPSFVGISQMAGQGELLDTSASGVAIPDDLIDSLADVDTTVTFLPFSEAIGPLEDGGKVRDDGVYLTFSPLSSDPVGGGYQMYASYYHAVDDAAGYSYIIAHENDKWIIKDRKQVWTR